MHTYALTATQPIAMLVFPKSACCGFFFFKEGGFVLETQ